MNNTIGIIGYGMVGKAVEFGFSKTSLIISDPKYNTTTISDVCSEDPAAIFVCVPTPTDDSNYQLLKNVLTEIKQTGYTGLTVVKSTVLSHHLDTFDVLYNPEFLSRATSFNDLVNPPMIIIGGSRANELLDIYNAYSTVDTSNAFLVDIPTACLAKYTMNSFYALKVTYMNSIYDIANSTDANYNQLIAILGAHPWMGTHHFNVPGPDGQRGFGGPCLPKDAEAFAKQFNIKLLATALELNTEYRKITELK
jgi:UDPglucose 6-dehydrogenase